MIKDGNFVNKEVTNEWKVEAERLHFLVAVVSWEDAQGQAVERAGSPFWRVCSIHIHNDLAKKRGAMEPIAESFWQMILELGVTFVGGDFNQGFPIMCEVLEQVLRRTQAPLAPHYHNPPPGDCAHLVSLLPARAALVARQSKSTVGVQPRDLLFRPSDCDWHYPIVVHWQSCNQRRKRKGPAVEVQPEGAQPAAVGRVTETSG